MKKFYDCFSLPKFYSHLKSLRPSRPMLKCDNKDVYYTRQFLLQAWLNCCHKIFSFCSEFNLKAVTKKYFFVTGKSGYEVDWTGVGILL